MNGADTTSHLLLAMDLLADKRRRWPFLSAGALAGSPLPGCHFYKSEHLPTHTDLTAGAGRLPAGWPSLLPCRSPPRCSTGHLTHRFVPDTKRQPGRLSFTGWTALSTTRVEQKLRPSAQRCMVVALDGTIISSSFSMARTALYHSVPILYHRPRHDIGQLSHHRFLPVRPGIPIDFFSQLLYDKGI